MKQPFSGEIGRQRFESERPRGTQAIIAHGPGDTTVGTGATTLYTVPDGKFFLIEEVTVTNAASGTETFDIYMVPNGGSAGTTNAVVNQEQVATKTSLRLTTLSGLMLNPQAILQAKSSSAGGINVTFWGVEITGI